MRARLVCLCLAAVWWALSVVQVSAQPPVGVVAAVDPTSPTSATPQAHAKFRTPLARLTATWPLVGGLLEGTADVACDWSAVPEGVRRSCRVQCAEVVHAGHTLGALDLRVELTPQGPARVEATLAGPLAKRIQFELTARLRMTVESGALTWVDDTVDAHIAAQGLDTAIVTRLFPGVGLTGTADGTVRVQGTRRAPLVDARLSSAALSWRGIPSAPAELVWKHAGRVSELRGRWGTDAGPAVTIDARIPLAMDLSDGVERLAWLDTEVHEVSLRGTRLDAPAIRPFLALPRGVGTTLNLEGRASGNLAGLDASIDLSGTLALATGRTVPVTAALTSQGSAQRVRVDLGGLLAAEVDTQASWAAVRASPAALGDARLGGEVRVDAGLEELAVWLPDGLASPSGRVRGRVALGGTVGNPALTGRLETNGAAVTLTDLNQRLDPVEAALVFSGAHATFETLRARVGEGTVTGRGAYTFAGATPAAGEARRRWSGWHVQGGAQLEVVNVPLVQQSLPLGVMNGRVHVESSHTPQLASLHVTLHAMQVRLSEEELPEARAIPSNRNVHVLDWLGRSTDRDALPGGGERNARLAITLADPIDVRGKKFAMKLTGALEVHRKGDIVTVDGGFEAEKGGTFQLFDNPFVTRSGRLSVVPGRLGRTPPLGAVVSSAGTEATVTVAVRDPDRPVEPAPLDGTVDFTAEGVVEGTLVVVQVRGPAARPEFVLVSNPPLPEYQILTLLIVGRVDAVDESNGRVRKEVAELTERFHNPSLQRQLFDRMGVDKIGVGFGESVAEPILTVGKQLSRRVYFETIYHHNAPPEENTTAGRMEYRLDPWWTTETTVGDAGNGDLGLYWALRFGGPPPPGPEALEQLGTKPPADRDGDKRADTVDQCIDVPEDTDGFEDDDGCLDPDNDGDGVPDTVDRAPGQAEVKNGYQDDDGAPDAAPAATTDLVVRIDPFEFVPGSTRPRADGDALRCALELLADFSETRFVLYGHTDDQDALERNLRLSERRAEAARALLVARGAARAQLDVQGVGSAEPLDPGTSEAGRARNRRVEMRVASAPLGTPPNGGDSGLPR